RAQLAVAMAMAALRSPRSMESTRALVRHACLKERLDHAVVHLPAPLLEEWTRIASAQLQCGAVDQVRVLVEHVQLQPQAAGPGALQADMTPAHPRRGIPEETAGIAHAQPELVEAGVALLHALEVDADHLGPGDQPEFGRVQP